MICHACHAEVAPEAKFCPKCGTRIEGTSSTLQATTKQCPQCGAENPVSAKFCRVDGYSFVTGPLASSQEVEIASTREQAAISRKAEIERPASTPAPLDTKEPPTRLTRARTAVTPPSSRNWKAPTIALTGILLLGVTGWLGYAAWIERTASIESVDKNCRNVFITLSLGMNTCDWHLTSKGDLLKVGKETSNPILVATAKELVKGNTQPVARVIVFPSSPQGWYSIIQVCEGNGGSSLCWYLWVYEHNSQALRQTSAGKYGPVQWISWSPDGQRAVLYNKNEEVNWIHIIDPQTGESKEYPPYNTGRGVLIDRSSLKWINHKEFSVRVAQCQKMYCEGTSFARDGVLQTVSIYDVSKQKVKDKKAFALTVKFIPEHARIRILNIRSRYSDGIRLKPGRYHIEVSAQGYNTQKNWITIADRDIVTSITLAANQALLNPFNADPFFVGIWYGKGYQPNGPNWTIRISAKHDKYLIEYPSLSCGGDLILLKKSEKAIEFRESLTYGKQKCINNGKVLINKTGDHTVDFGWFYANGQQGGKGSLSRVIQ